MQEDLALYHPKEIGRQEKQNAFYEYSMRIIYRISDVGYSKVKPDYITNENCLANAVKVTLVWDYIADNISEETNNK